MPRPHADMHTHKVNTFKAAEKTHQVGCKGAIDLIHVLATLVQISRLESAFNFARVQIDTVLGRPTINSRWNQIVNGIPVMLVDVSQQMPVLSIERRPVHHGGKFPYGVLRQLTFIPQMCAKAGPDTRGSVRRRRRSKGLEKSDRSEGSGGLPTTSRASIAPSEVAAAAAAAAQAAAAAATAASAALGDPGLIPSQASLAAAKAAAASAAAIAASIRAKREAAVAGDAAVAAPTPETTPAPSLLASPSGAKPAAVAPASLAAERASVAAEVQTSAVAPARSPSAAPSAKRTASQARGLTNETTVGDKRGHWQRILQIVEEKHAAGLMPDRKHFHSAISECEKAGCTKRAMSFLMREMKSSKLQVSYVKSNEAACISAIVALEEAGLYTVVDGLLAELFPTKDAHTTSKDGMVPDAGKQVSTREVAPKLMRRAFYSHHIINPKKRKLIRTKTTSLGLGSVAKIGWPGLIIVEGEEQKVRDFTSALKRQKWQFFAQRAEQILEVSPGTQLDELRKLPLGFEEFDENSMSEFAEACKDYGAEDLFRAAMSLPPIL